MAHETDRLTYPPTTEPLAVAVCPSCAFPVAVPHGSTVAVCWCHAVVRVPEAIYKGATPTRK